MILAAKTAGTPLWYLSRGSGIVTLLLLTATLALGILTSKRWAPRNVPRFVTGDLHRSVSLISLAFLALHVATVVLDGYVPIRWLDAVVPFTASYRPFWLGLGAIACDLLLAILVTSGLRRRMPYTTWRWIHLSAYACWPIAAVHSLGMGTDAMAVWSLGTLVLSTIGLLGLVAWRSAGVDPTATTRSPRLRQEPRLRQGTVHR